MSDIAAMTGKSLPVVSNWRRRDKDDFPPAAAEGQRGSLFAAQDVIRWLDNKGKKYDRKEVSPAALAWNAANAMRSDYPTEEIEAALFQAAALTALDPGGSDDRVRERVSRVLRMDTHRRLTPGDFAQLVDAAEGPQGTAVEAAISALDAAGAESVAATFDDLLARGANFAGEESWTPQSLTVLMSRFAGSSAETFYDPACGTGALLSEALSRTSFSEPQGFGQEISAQAAQKARLRFAALNQDVDVRVGDTLSNDLLRERLADVVLCHPPFGLKHSGSSMDTRWKFGSAPLSSADLMWIQQAVAHLSLDGIGLVITPMGPLFRGGREQTTRAELIRRGAVEAVIALPGRMLPNTAIPVALWVLRHPDRTETADSVLFMDASDLGHRAGKRVELPHEAIERLVQILTSWQSSRTLPPSEKEIAAVVSCVDVIGSDVTLLPARWIQPSIDVLEDQEQVAVELARVQNSLEELTRSTPLPRLGLSGTTERAMVTVDRLIADGLLELIKTVTVTGKDLHDRGVPVVSAKDVQLVRRANESKRFAWARKDVPTTKPGDLLIAPSVTHGIATLVETEARIPARGLIVLRATGGWISAAALEHLIIWNSATAATSTLAHVKVKDLAIPLLSDQERAELSKFYDSLSHHKHLARNYEAALDDLSKQVRAAVPHTAQFHLSAAG